MKRQYTISFDVASAEGLMASKYEGTTGEGVLIVDGTDFTAPEGKVFTVTGTVTRAIDINGKPLDDGTLERLKLGPLSFTYQSAPTAFQGSSWTATLKLTLSDDQSTLQAVLDGTGTGFARFAAKNIRVIVNGRLVA